MVDTFSSYNHRHATHISFTISFFVVAIYIVICMLKYVTHSFRWSTTCISRIICLLVSTIHISKERKRVVPAISSSCWPRESITYGRESGLVPRDVLLEIWLQLQLLRVGVRPVVTFVSRFSLLDIFDFQPFQTSRGMCHQRHSVSFQAEVTHHKTRTTTVRRPTPHSERAAPLVVWKQMKAKAARNVTILHARHTIRTTGIVYMMRSTHPHISKAYGRP